MRASRLLCIPLVLFAACTEHEPEIDRVGGPIPDAGSSGDCRLTPDPAGQFPCEVDTILYDRCRRCHSNPTRNGAPFPLVSWSDSLGDYGGPIYELMRKHVKTGFMPYCSDGTCSAETVASFGGTVLALSVEQKETLLAYLLCPEPSYGLNCPTAGASPP